MSDSSVNWFHLVTALEQPPARAVATIARARPPVPEADDDPFRLPEPPEAGHVAEVSRRLDQWLERMYRHWQEFNGPARTFAALVAMEGARDADVAVGGEHLQPAIEGAYQFLDGELSMRDWRQRLERLAAAIDRNRPRDVALEDPERNVSIPLAWFLDRPSWPATETAVRHWWLRVRERLAFRDGTRPVFDGLQLEFDPSWPIQFRGSSGRIATMLLWVGDAGAVLEPLAAMCSEQAATSATDPERLALVDRTLSDTLARQFCEPTTCRCSPAAWRRWTATETNSGGGWAAPPRTSNSQRWQ